MGSDAIALPLLDFLADEGGRAIALLGVMTRPDRPAGRGKQLRANAIKRWALDRGLRVWQPERPGEAEVALFREKGVELALVMAYGHLLRRALLEAPLRGTYNVHTSLLPAYRGASPIQAAIASGDDETGVTLMKMVPRMDAGPVVDRECVRVDRRDTALDLEEKLARACVPMLRRNLEAMASGTAAVREQEEASASYCRKLTKEDGTLDFERPAGLLARRVNALHPWPGVGIPVGETVVKAGRADFESGAAEGEPGTVLGTGAGALRVAAGDGVVRLLELQRPGGRMLPAEGFLRGFPISPGTVLPSRPMTELVRGQPFPAEKKR